MLLLGIGNRDEREFDVAIVRPAPAMAECLIYDIVGPNVHVVASGLITFRERKRR
jgi:hypothetical protein